MHLEIKQATDKIEIVSALVIDKLYQLAFEDQATGVVSLLDVTSDIQGHIQAPAAYEDAVKYLVGIEAGDTKRFPNLYIDIPNQNYFIRFKDPIIRDFCITNYGSGDGVTKNMAAGITNNLFWGKNSMSQDLKNLVTSLDDLLYFTGISPKTALVNFPNATSITFANITYNISEYYVGYFINDNKLLTINYQNALFVYTGTGDGFRIIIYNTAILEWNDNLIPNLTDLYKINLFYAWSKLTKIIYREGITRVDANSYGNDSLLYIEFPVSITSIGNAYGFGRSNYHRIAAMVIKATTPPEWYGWHPNETSLSGHGFGWDAFPTYIYVPDSAVTAYKSVTATGLTTDQAWASQYIKDLIKPLSELPQVYREMGTVTQEDIDRV